MKNLVCERYTGIQRENKSNGVTKMGFFFPSRGDKIFENKRPCGFLT